MAALGAVRVLEATGPGRFRQVARAWQALVADAVFNELAGPPGSGLIAAGGFAFAGTGASSPFWAGFAPASLIVPQLSLARADGQTG